MNKINFKQWLIIIGVIAALVLVKISLAYHYDSIKSRNNDIETLPVAKTGAEPSGAGEAAATGDAAADASSNDDGECDIREGCPLPNGAVVRIEGAVINTIKPFAMYVTQAPADTDKVHASFSMTDMDMGFNRYKFFKNPDNPRDWTAAKVLLPVCVVSRKDYLLDLTIGPKTYRIPLYAN